MDFGPSKRAKDKADRYHFWDFDSDTKSHILSLLPKQIRSIHPMNINFDPGEFITWEIDWFLKRNWGIYS